MSNNEDPINKAGDDLRKRAASAAQDKKLSTPDTGPITDALKRELERAVELKGYVPLPEILRDSDGKPLPHWRLRLDIEGETPDIVGIELYGSITLGRQMDGEESLLDLTPYEAEEKGVSRRHAELRVTPHSLSIVDLGSTNGTYKNGVELKANNPSPLGNRDTLSLGMLHITVNIIDAPHREDEWFERQATLAQALTEMAKTITAQLKVEDVLKIAVDYARGLAHAQVAMLWLLEPGKDALHLEAESGMDTAVSKDMTVPLKDSLIGEVLLSGKPQMHTRSQPGERLVISKGYSLDSVIFVPMRLGELAMGVLSVGNNTAQHEFTHRDQTLLVALADLAAIALQNSQAMEATDEALYASLQAQRVATSQALESNRLKSEFLSTVSHELRSPLHTINGFSKMAMTGDLGEMAPAVEDALERIHRNGSRLLEMVDGLLDSMRVEAKDLTLENVEFSPRELIDEIVEGQRPVADDKSLKLKLEHDNEIPERVMGDEKRVQQVLLNLVSNAIKFTDEGEVSVRAAMVGLAMWAVYVKDTGPGINNEQQEVIFERFRQVDQSTTREKGGVGLGLAISRDLVNLMGGALRVSSSGEPGKGTIFSLTLPLVRPGQDQPAWVQTDEGGKDVAKGDAPDTLIMGGRNTK